MIVLNLIRVIVMITLSSTGSETKPSPTDYNTHLSDAVTRPHAPAFTHSIRRGGTVLWSVGGTALLDMRE